MRIVDRVKRVCILLVEDSEVFRNGLTHVLESQHAIVLGARNHAVARELIGLHWKEIDAIILDACVEPPYLEYDAHRLLKPVVRLNARREQPALILGLSTDKRVRLQLMRDGCTGAIAKTHELVEFLPTFLSDIYERHLVSTTFKKPSE